MTSYADEGSGKDRVEKLLKRARVDETVSKEDSCGMS